MMPRAAYPLLGLAVGLLCAAVAAQDNGAAATDAPAQPTAAAAFDDAARSPESVKKGEARFAEVAKAYRSAPTLTDTIKIAVVTPMGPQNEQIELAFGKGTDMKLDVQGMKITSVNNELFVQIDEVSTEKYVGVPIKDGDIPGTLEGVAAGFNLPLPHMGFRFGKTDEDFMKGMTAASLDGLKVGGFREVDGGQEILFEAANGTGVAHVDGKSGLLESYIVDFRPFGAPEGMNFTLNFDFSPVAAEALATPIAFDPGTRKRVATLDEMMQKLQVGDPAPTFTLKTSTGEDVSLADLKGKVVVLDFWATWCGPCRKGLPLVSEFAKWASESGTPVVVYGVNVWEDQEKDAAKRTEQATKFWTEQKFAFPTLLDLDDKVAGEYGPNGIPTTFIIDAQGRIAKVHTGFDPEMVETLKKDVQAIIQAQG
ncbi:MAG: TlpA family protein disulfide reductase [Phycisphaerales bacterium]|nr:TlpA family protein disulfide reductase [Phycisphaerales bacterium]